MIGALQHMVGMKTAAWNWGFPTLQPDLKYFAALELYNQSIEELYLIRKRRSTDFEARKL